MHLYMYNEYFYCIGLYSKWIVIYCNLCLLYRFVFRVIPFTHFSMHSIFSQLEMIDFLLRGMLLTSNTNLAHAYLVRMF